MLTFAVEKRRSPSRLYLIWVIDLSCPCNIKGFILTVIWCFLSEVRVFYDTEILKKEWKQRNNNETMMITFDEEEHRSGTGEGRKWKKKRSPTAILFPPNQFRGNHITPQPQSWEFQLPLAWIPQTTWSWVSRDRSSWIRSWRWRCKRWSCFLSTSLSPISDRSYRRPAKKEKTGRHRITKLN